jgi:hypothetical protein
MRQLQRVLRCCRAFGAGQAHECLALAQTSLGGMLDRPGVVVNEALDAVRREESPSTPGLKKTRYDWLKNPGDLTQSQSFR